MKPTAVSQGLFALIAILLLWTTAHACLIAGKASTPVQIADEEAIIVWDAAHHREDFIRRATFRTGARDFGFLVPTPTVPRLAAVDPSAFPLLERLSAPALTRGELTTHARGETQSKGVDVLRTQRVGGYDAAVLSAADARGLAAWLRGHGYEAPPAMAEWIAPYVKAHWAITAFKVARDAAPMASLAPVRLSFATDRPFYPYREPAADPSRPAKTTPRLLRVFFLSRCRASGAFESAAPRRWPGRVVTAKNIDADPNFASVIAHDLALASAQMPSPLWVTLFEDRSSPRPAVADVYFTADAGKAAQRSRPERPQLYQLTRGGEWAENQQESNTLARGEEGMLRSTLWARVAVVGLAATIGNGAAAAPPKKAAPPAAVQKALQSLYDAQDAALSRHEVRQAMAAYAPGYVAVGEDGTRHTRDEEFDALEKVCAMGQNLRQHSRIEKIITRGGQASLVLRQQTAVDLFNPNTHQQLVLHTEGVRQELWARTPDGWRLTFSKTVLQRSFTGADDPAPAAAPTQAAARPRRALTASRPTPSAPKASAAF